MSDNVQIIGARELAAAVKRNPTTIRDETRKFIVRGLSKYRKGTQSQPWRLGGMGGGAPVASRNLVDSHITRIRSFSGSFGPNERVAPYARWVHEGTRRMDARPWLDYVKKQNNHRIRSLYMELLRNISKDLAK